LILGLLLAAPACRENRPTADRTVTPAADSTMMHDPMKTDSMLDTMPGGEMARGNDSATMRLIKKKM
jgi:hypothetical protein